MNGLVLRLKAGFRTAVLVSAGASLPLTPLLAQTAPPMAAPPPGVPGAVAQPQVAPEPPPPLPPAVWDQRNVIDLIAYIQQIGVEGLNPADYDPNGLTAAMGSGDLMRMSAEATDRFNRVSSDLDELAADHAGLMDALINAPPPSARAALLDHLRRQQTTHRLVGQRGKKSQRVLLDGLDPSRASGGDHLRVGIHATCGDAGVCEGG